MNANQEADYSRAISCLLLQGYKLKKLISVAKTMHEEQQAGNEEHWANYDMAAEHARQASIRLTTKGSLRSEPRRLRFSMKRKRRKGEVVCRCGAYRFPHRFLSGECDGSGYVQEIYEPWSTCKGCNFLEDGITCVVLDGREPVHHCPELQQYERYEGVKRYGIHRLATSSGCLRRNAR